MNLRLISPKWSNIYYLLVVFNVLAIALGLYLSQQPFASLLSVQLVELLLATLIVLVMGAAALCARVSVRQRAADTRAKELSAQILRDAEARTRNILETTAEAVVTFDESGVIESFNSSAEKLFGYSRTELAGQNVGLLFPGSKGKSCAEMCGESLVSGAPVQCEVTGQGKDGRTFPLEVAISEWRLDHQRLFTGLMRDISERKRAEDATHAADQRAITDYKRLLERLATLAQALGSARQLNAVYRALYDFARVSMPCHSILISLYDAEQRHHEPVYMCVDNEEIDVSSRPSRPLASSSPGDAVPSAEVIMKDVYQATLSEQPGIEPETNPPLPSATLVAPMAIMGRIVGAVEVQSVEPDAFQVEDATALQMATNLAANAIENVQLFQRERGKEEQMRQSQKMEALGTLAGGIAHDFNNLLTSMLGNTQLARRKLPPDAPVQERLLEVEKAAVRAGALTRQLLAFSRRQQLERKSVNLNHTITDIMKMLHRIIGEEVEVRMRATPDLWPVFADPNQVEQVIMNLAINARDAMPGGGELMIETRNVEVDAASNHHHVDATPGRYSLITVSDTGMGMDAATQQRIFEPFFTTKDAGKGTGLGLAMVDGIVRQHDGFVEVVSEPGCGTTFKIYLPVVEKEERVKTVETNTPLRGGHETILIAEDDEGLRGLVQVVLEELGYTVKLASEGKEAVDIFEKEHGLINLVLLDVVMPRMGGREAFERIRGLSARVPVVFMTGYSADTIQGQFIKESGSLLIQKPYSVEMLGRSVREVLDLAGVENLVH